MLQRIYIHNFRCLENFEFKLGDQHSALLIGKNGSGKSTLREAIKVFQSIGRGSTRIGQLVKPEDFTMGRSAIPMRFELDAKLGSDLFSYALALELPDKFRELRVKEERLSMNQDVLFSREQSFVIVPRVHSEEEARFRIDWHMAALPVIQGPSPGSALSIFREWLANIVLLTPIPRLMSGGAENGTQEPSEDAGNWADWLSGLLDRYPAAYSTIKHDLVGVMPDLADFRFERTGKDAKSLLVNFKNDQNECELPFEALSDGEKCFFLYAVVLAANRFDGPLFTFWDEPDSHLSLSEVSQFVIALRRGFQQGGQILITSHNAEAIRRFSNDSTWLLGRRSHLEPTLIRLLQDVAPTADLIQKLVEGDIDPWQ